MSIRPDADQTLPSVSIASPGVGIDQSLVLTIIFHPDLYFFFYYLNIHRVHVQTVLVKE